jgi:hypothetical protein
MIYTDYWIWTIQMSQWRYARDLNIPMVDITVKSGIKTFAPTWENLKAYRAGAMSKADYAREYYDKVLASFKTNEQDWKDLAANHNVAYACYCKPGDFCHRHFFAPLAIAYLQSIGKKVQFMGELIPHPNNQALYDRPIEPPHAPMWVDPYRF